MGVIREQVPIDRRVVVDDELFQGPGDAELRPRLQSHLEEFQFLQARALGGDGGNVVGGDHRLESISYTAIQFFTLIYWEMSSVLIWT